MSDRKKVFLYRSGKENEIVSPKDVEYGELAMNYNSTAPFLMFKDSEDNIVKVGTITDDINGESTYKTVSQKGINEALKMPSGYNVTYNEELDENLFVTTKGGDTIYTAIENIDSNVSTLVDEVLKNEEVTAAALTKHNESCGFDENGEYVPQTEGVLSSATNLYEADMALANELEIVKTSVSNANATISDSYTSVEYPNTNYENIKSGDSLDEVAKKLEENIDYVATIVDEIDGLKTVKVNGDSGTTDTEGNLVIELDGKEIKITEGYESVTYPTISNTAVTFTPVSANSTLEDAIKQVDTNVSTLVSEVLKNEETIAKALTNHNEASGFDENANYVINTGATYISGATSLAHADDILDDAISTVNGDVNTLKDNITSINSKVDNNTNTITNINNTISEIQGDITNIEGDITDIEGDITSINENITKITSSITEITENVADIPTITINSVEGTDVSEEEAETKTLNFVLDGSNLKLSTSYTENSDIEVVSGLTFVAVNAETSIDESIKQIEDNVFKLVDEVLKDEDITSAALNKINSSAGLTVNGEYEANADTQYIKEATTLFDADLKLDAAILSVDGTVTNLSGRVDEISTSIEDITNQVSNIETVTINGESGEEQEDSNVVNFTLNGSNLKLSSDYEANEDYVVEEDEIVFTAITSGMSFDASIKQVEDNVFKLVGEVLKDEETVAKTLTQHNDSCGFDVNANYVKVESAKYISDADSLADADNLLDTAIFTVSGNVDNLSNTVNTLSANTNNLSETVNSLSGTIETLSGNVENISVDFKVNGIEAEVPEGGSVKEVTLYSDDINIQSEYESVTYAKDSFTAVTSGDTIDSAINKLDTNISTLVNEVLSNEKVTAAALTKHNESCGFDDNGEYVGIEGATSLVEADGILLEKINGLNASNINLNEYALESDVAYPSDLVTGSFTAVSADSSIQDAIKTVETNVVELINQVLINEEVTSEALNVQNKSCGLSSNGEYQLYDNSENILSAATSLNHADDLLAKQIENILTRLTVIEAQLGITSQSVETTNEEVSDEQVSEEPIEQSDETNNDEPNAE